MKDDTRSTHIVSIGSQDVLTEILKEGARDMLASAIENEVAEYIAQHANKRDPNGHRLVVRNGYLPERSIQTGIGSIPVQQPRVHDKRHGEQFASIILPPYLRKTKSLEELIPWLYLKGISTSDFAEPLRALLGPQAKGISANSIVRMKRCWHDQWKDWSKRSLADKKYVYVWADGIHFNIRLEDKGNDKQCILVLMGATETGKKELISVVDGYRESTQSWQELLLDIKQRGLTTAPKLAIGDGAMGFWAALRKVYPTTRIQRCWVHKTANVQNRLPKHLQSKSKAMLHDIWMADTKAHAEKSFDLFVTTFTDKYPKAVECLQKDRDVLLTFYDFPAKHWVHIRTSNPIESTFATVRLRTAKTRGSGSRTACLTMVFKLVQSAEKRWRSLKGSELLPEVISGIRFINGVKEQAA
jgi:putative transposase